MCRSVIFGFIALTGWLISTSAIAQCTSYPYTLTNGTTATATQVMANFNCAALTSGSTINNLTLTGATTLPGSGTITSSGYVGIGQSSPGADLSFPDVTASTAPDGMTWYNPYPTVFGIWKTAGTWTGPNYQQLEISFPTGIVIDGGYANGKSGTVMQPNGGNVGIGTTSPASNLTVINSAGGGYVGPTSGTWAARIVNASNNDLQSGLSVQTAWANTDSTIFEAAAGWNGSSVGYYPLFTINGIGDITAKPINTDSTTADQFQNSSGTTILDVDSSNQRIGIGTTAPAYGLEVYNGGNNAAAYTVSGHSGNQATVGVWDITTSSVGAYLFSGAGGNAGIATVNNSGSYTSTPVNFTSSGNTIFNGNVGIGTTSPAGSLHVQNTSAPIIFTPQGNSTSTNNIGVVIRNQGYTAGQYSSRFVSVDNGGGIDIYVQTNESGDNSTWVSEARFAPYSGNSNKFETFGQTALATGGGNVGIGTTTPNSILDVLGSSASSPGTGNGNLTIQGGGGNGLLVGTLSGSPYSTWLQSGYVANLATHPYPLVLNPLGGSVGIGTTSPGQTLEVNGKIQVDALASASATNLCINGSVISSCSSSIRYKEQVQDAPFGLKEIKAMRPVTFKWKGRDERDFGFIAEEMAKIDPLFITYRAGKIEGVKYPQLTAVLVKAVQQQQVQVAALKAVNDNQSSQIRALRLQVSSQQQLINAVKSSNSDAMARLMSRLSLLERRNGTNIAAK